MSKHEILTKYSKFFAADPKARNPILEGVHYAADGSAVVTNRQFLLRLRGAHSFQQDITLHHKTGAPIEGIYPNTSRTFPQYKAQMAIRFGAELDKAIKHTKVALVTSEQWDKRHPLIRVVVEKGVAYLVFNDDGFNVKGFFGNTFDLSDSIRALNARYLLTALQVFDHAKSDLTIHWDTPSSPILLSNGEDIDIIIMPYRIAV